jgi:hypothetical protein
MDANKKNGYIAVAVTVAVLGAAWYMYSHTKRFYAAKITRLGGSSGFAVLMTFDQGYLKAWAKAIGKAKPTFTYDGNNYNTQGGMLVKT